MATPSAWRFLSYTDPNREFAVDVRLGKVRLREGGEGLDPGERGLEGHDYFGVSFGVSGVLPAVFCTGFESAAGAVNGLAPNRNERPKKKLGL